MSLLLRWSLLPIALASVVVAGSSAAFGSPQESAATIAWERELAAAQQRARAEQKPLLLVFRCER